MGKTRALMTDTERERLAELADVEKIKVYQAKSRVRRRIHEELTFDVEILAEHHPDLLAELRDVVNEEPGSSSNETVAKPRPTATKPTPSPDSGDSSETKDQTPDESPAIGETPDGDVLDETNLPQGKDLEDAKAAVYAAKEFLRENGPASMREIVNGVMPDHPLGYQVPDLEEGDRFRGAWWRRIVQPGLKSLPGVEYRENYGDYRLRE